MPSVLPTSARILGSASIACTQVLQVVILEIWEGHELSTEFNGEPLRITKNSVLGPDDLFSSESTETDHDEKHTRIDLSDVSYRRQLRYRFDVDAVVPKDKDKGAFRVVVRKIRQTPTHTLPFVSEFILFDYGPRERRKT